MERTDCEVENFCGEISIRNPRYVDGSQPYFYPQSRGVNSINWKSGLVKSGDICCRRFGKDCVFKGNRLLYVSIDKGAKFLGKEKINVSF